MPDRPDVVVIGSGPNGLAAAVTAARAGLDVLVVEEQSTAGGGARTLPDEYGLMHDVCSAVHPLAWASPFFREFDLAARGVELLAPDVSYAHPLPDGGAALAFHDLARTAAALGHDGDRWAAWFGPLSQNWEQVAGALLGRSVRPTPAAIRTALLALTQARGAGPFRTPEAQALLAGVAAHTSTPLPSLAAGGTAALLGALAHGPGGWPVPRGGSQAIVDALLTDLKAHGGRVELGRAVRRRADLPQARGYVFDTAPDVADRILGVTGRRSARAPHTTSAGPKAQAGRSWRGPGHAGAARVDLVLDGPVPWQHAGVGAAGTVHVGGWRSEVVEAERIVAGGRHVDRPVVLLSDPAVADPDRIVGGLRPVWTYAHVPLGSTRDVTEDVLAQIERFAPGVRDRVVSTRCIPAAEMSEHNANLIAGDIAGGRVTVPRVLFGPRLGRSPWATHDDAAVLASASTPPGPGVHGMGGCFAARRLLRRGFGLPVPSVAP